MRLKGEGTGGGERMEGWGGERGGKGGEGIGKGCLLLKGGLVTPLPNTQRRRDATV